MLAGIYKNLVRTTAPRQLIIIKSSGVGDSASAIIGAKIVIERAVTLQIPNTVPKKALGKYTRVVIYSIPKAEAIPKNANRTANGTIDVASF